METGLFPDFDQRINILQALLAVTRMPAWQNKLDDRLGSLKEGLAADFVILDQDPFEVAENSPEKLASIRVAATLVADRLVYGFLPGSVVSASAPVPSYRDRQGPHLTMTACRMLEKAVFPLSAGENACLAPAPSGTRRKAGASRSFRWT